MCWTGALTALSEQGGAGQGGGVVRRVAESWDGGYGEALEWVGVGVRVGRAVGGQVAGVAGLLLGGGGAVVAALGVGQDLRRAGDLGGGDGRRKELGAGRVPHRLCRRREGADK